MDPLNSVRQTINCLTDNEDYRQSLWVHYLNGNSIESFSAHLSQLKLETQISKETEKFIFLMMRDDESNKIQSILSNFSTYEQSIMCLLVLGLSVQEISTLKGISEVRIRQSLATIRYNPYWEKEYGFKKEPNRRRALRSHRRRN